MDIVLTGSNANLLASELATRLSGRTIQQMLLPFSLAEDRELVPDLTLNDYFRCGGFPGVLQLSDEQQKLNLLDDLTDSILCDILPPLLEVGASRSSSLTAAASAS